MDKKLTVINNDDIEKAKINRADKAAKYNELWHRQFKHSISHAMEKNKDIEISEYPQHDLMKIALSGIKYVNSKSDVHYGSLKTNYTQSLGASQAVYELMDVIFMVCGYLTLRNFVNVFPIEKEYDGEKWESKDYFYTMKILSEMDWDKPVGRDNISNLLWDYQNDELRNAYIDYTCAASNIYKKQTGKSIAEKLCEDMDIGTYTINENLGIIQDNKTGKISKLNDKPSHLHVVK